MRRAVLLLTLAIPLAASDWYLFASFRGNGETGVYFALSRDGLKWTPANDNRPWIKPGAEGMLMRDPFLARGPDGTWHMLWTWGWTRKETGGVLRIGYSSSKDLIDWSEQREIRVMDDEPTARNAWAPEAAWDAQRKEWIVFWSTTIPGRFPDTEQTGDSGYNHRLYSIRTKDFRTFTKAELWFDPGFNAIDATLVRDGRRWVMVFKDERRNPLQKRLRVAFADSPAGPWRGVSEPISRDWVEGPSVLKIGRDWFIYYDHYSKPQHYGALRTRDWKKFEDITNKLDSWV
jgi:hypothetical protein